MDAPAEVFSANRSRLFGVAYRMLGSRADAEDILQDAYIRWRESDVSEVRNPEAWLVTIVTRLCIDRLRLAKTEREAYVGPWLPEPLVSPRALTPDRTSELASDISLAFLMVLERLSPEERAAFLLREVFDFDYGEISRIVGKSEAACRQAVHRAKERVQQGRPRYTVSREAHTRLLEAFVAAAHSAERDPIMRLLADDARVTADGGGKVPSFRKVIQGADPVARLYAGLGRKYGDRLTYRIAEINGAPGLLRYFDGELESVQTFVSDGQRILEVYILRNPDKLKAIAPAD
jgi:RNA polymerase sigma-70 factor (ECF subfamily)